ncbi:MAG: DNA-processing protein DprA, partial [Actinomycetota bacterium]|nr:DNA-processing protein DprA [Actinomycetota bacterium]
RAGARFLVPGDPEWPEGVDDLSRLAAEPLGLWVRGPLDVRVTAARAVSLVGSRSASGYGQHVAGELAAQLADRGWAVVSGGAYGVDGAAHRGALAAGGGTVAVMANGIDVHYPRGHEALLRRIADDGLLLTELPPGCAPQRHRFLTRNRVIAALGAGTVVVEAGLRSGARSTAGHSAKLGRPTMAVPGPVTSATSAGCHVLLRGGATLVTRAAEVVEEVGRLGLDLAPDQRGPVGWRDALSESVRRVLDAVPVGSAAGPAQIARVAGVDQLTVLRSLGPLEREGLVVADVGGYRQTARARAR